EVEVLLRGFAARDRQHRRGKIDPGHAMPARRQLKAEKPGAAADIERRQRRPCRHDEIENAVPRGALRGGFDAVAKILGKMRRPAIPMLGNLLLYRVGIGHAHFSPTTSANASTCSS